MRSDIFRPRVDAEPGNILFRFSLGQALFEEGEFEASIGHLEKCAASRADWLIPRLLLGQAYFRMGHHEAARQWLSDALALAETQSHDDPAAECRRLLAEMSGK